MPQILSTGEQRRCRSQHPTNQGNQSYCHSLHYAALLKLEFRHSIVCNTHPYVLGA